MVVIRFWSKWRKKSPVKHKAKEAVPNVIAVNDKVFNADIFFDVYKAMQVKNDSLQHIINNNPAFISNDVHDINAVKMQYQYFYGFMNLMTGRDAIASAQAKKLIALLEKEYHLEHEWPEARTPNIASYVKRF